MDAFKKNILLYILEKQKDTLIETFFQNKKIENVILYYIYLI